MVVTENNRIKILEDDLGRSILRFREAHATDTGIYKVTARNKSGQTIARCRQVNSHMHQVLIALDKLNTAAKILVFYNCGQEMCEVYYNNNLQVKEVLESHELNFVQIMQYNMFMNLSFWKTS